MTDFNSRPSARGDSASRMEKSSSFIFQFTPLREGRRRYEWMVRQVILFQFTPLREGRQFLSEAVAAGRIISIHAPPRGATTLFSSWNVRSTFQFTPLREGRPERRKRNERVCNFNSRPSARGDQHGQRLGLYFTYFNSRPSARGDSASMISRASPLVFQFTPLREGRQSCAIRTNVRKLFQFTPLREGRLCPQSICQYQKNISIHAPPRGATIRYSNVIPNVRFQFTPLREGRRRAGWARQAATRAFQFTPLREGRRYLYGYQQ